MKGTFEREPEVSQNKHLAWCLRVLGSKGSACQIGSETPILGNSHVGDSSVCYRLEQSTRILFDTTEGLHSKGYAFSKRGKEYKGRDGER